MRIALIVVLLALVSGCAAHRHCRYVTRTAGYTQYVCEVSKQFPKEVK